MPGVPFSIVRDVEERDGRRFASSETPWLKCEIDVRPLAGRWLRLTYASGLLDPLARPVLRIIIGSGRRDEIMPAALHGRGFWLGSIPVGATEIWISPTSRVGPFSFRIEDWRVVSRGRLLAEVFAVDPWRGSKCFWAGLLGHRDLARLQVRRALCATPLGRYDSWRRARLRGFDRDGFDRPPAAPGEIPHFRFVALGEVTSSGAVDALWRRLNSQPYPNWSLVVRGVEPGVAAGKPKVLLVPRESPASQWIEGLKEHDYLIPIGEDDLLPDYALDALAIESRRRPDVDVFYTDEDAIDPRGRHGDPRLKPDWSPIFQTAVPYLGAAVAIRAGFASAWPASEFPAFGLAMESRTCRVFHIRRILLTRSRASVAPSVAPALRAPTRESGPSSVDSELRASVIIPTRDRLGLLMRCIASVRKRTVGVNFELIVVDNGSVEPRTRAYLQELARDTNCRVFPCPGPFNYSQLCNQAARAARAPFLVFLNNDVQILNDLWLSRLLSLAAMPDVGAVGAKLLYSNGGIQHAGVVLGIDGRAGHFQRGLSASDLGYFGSLGSPHEVSAVTAACMAIEATKFAAIGGFDEINLPVELNDVDLCLRLNARGWKTLLEARATLTHLESASRGANALLDARYDRQVAYFTERWSQALRDDPYFHPALSLDALQAALG